MAVVLLSLSGSAYADPPPAPTQDFREIIRRARAKVFPALIYVAPVVEEYSGGRRERREVGGSGVVISPDGLAVTNWHVIQNAVTIRVLLSDGSFTRAQVVGVDPETDLGLIRLEAPRAESASSTLLPAKLPFASFADSSRLEPGDFVLAMGAPWGLSRSISQGIIAATERYLEGRSEYSLWLQTDASINPGNSGGPLVNTDGEVVGINTLGSSGGGDLGFAVPSNTVVQIVESLRRDGLVGRAWTGLRLQPLRDFSRNLVFEADRGVLVASIDRGSPAERAGFEVGDLLLELNGSPFFARFREEIPEINARLAALPIDRDATLRVRRGTAERTLELTPALRGRSSGSDLELPRWNLTVKAIDKEAHSTLSAFAEDGVFVQGLRRPGNAARSGLRRGDIIVRADGVAIESIADLDAVYECVANRDGEPVVLIEVLRRGARRQVVLDFRREYGP